jgi:hypothetical protein
MELSIFTDGIQERNRIIAEAIRSEGLYVSVRKSAYSITPKN